MIKHKERYADVAHLVERHLAKVEVASSSLVIRSIKRTIRKNRPFCFVLSSGVPAALTQSAGRVIIKKKGHSRIDGYVLDTAFQN